MFRNKRKSDHEKTIRLSNDFIDSFLLRNSCNESLMTDTQAFPVEQTIQHEGSRILRGCDGRVINALTLLFQSLFCFNVSTNSSCMLKWGNFETLPVEECDKFPFVIHCTRASSFLLSLRVYSCGSSSLKLIFLIIPIQCSFFLGGVWVCFGCYCRPFVLKCGHCSISCSRRRISSCLLFKFMPLF